MIAFIIGLIILTTIVILGIKKDKTEKEIIVEYYKEDLQFLSLINTHRKSLNLKTLKPIQSLNIRAKETVEKLPPVEKHYNSNEIAGGEHQTLNALFQHYLKSNEHKKVIEYKNYFYIGIGVKKLNNKYYNITIFK